MPNFFNATVAGHVGKSETFTYQDKTGQRTGVRFSIAYNPPGKDKAGNKKQSVWLQCTAFNAPDWIAQGLQKGVPVIASVTPEMESWRDKNGEEKQTLKWQARDVQILIKGNREIKAHPESDNVVGLPDTLDDDLPF
jgi:single-stranded DNA-binding protein